MSKNDNNNYWRENIKNLVILMSLWFIVSYGFGIILVDQLNQYSIGGFPLGFWFAQQGSIYAFIVIIAIYLVLMNRLDKKYNLND